MKTLEKYISIFFVVILWTISAKADGYIGNNGIRFSFLGNEYSIKTRVIPEGFPNNQNNANNFSTTIKLLDTYCAEILPELSIIRNKLNLSDWYFNRSYKKRKTTGGIPIANGFCWPEADSVPCCAPSTINYCCILKAIQPFTIFPLK